MRLTKIRNVDTAKGLQGFPGGASGKETTCQYRMWIQPLGWEDPLEESMATLSSILAWRTPLDKRAWWAIAHEVTELDMTEQLSTCTHTHVHTSLITH